MGLSQESKTHTPYLLSHSLLPTSRDDREWLKTYETRPDSIFRYYSLENEVEFLTKIETIPLERRKYYIAENVKRFLGEFVGHVPYTTIPYEITPKGFEYAGFPVMNSYRKAAELGGEREHAEIDGFAQIESAFVQGMQERRTPQTAFWISPPKTADYGFVFVLASEQNGRVKEYVLRYDEKKGSLHTSNELIHLIDASAPALASSDSFLRRPLFGATVSRDNLDAVLQAVGIDQHQIQKSRGFEEQIERNLGQWIEAFSDIVCQLPFYEPGSPYFQAGMEQAKKALITIYQKAEQILSTISTRSLSFSSRQKDDLFAQMALVHSIQKDLPSALQGSCPSIRKNDSSVAFLSNSDMLRALQTTTIESVLKGETFPCPKCNYQIPAGKGIEKCPNPDCRITKEQYAQEVGSVLCD